MATVLKPCYFREGGDPYLFESGLPPSQDDVVALVSIELTLR